MSLRVELEPKLEKEFREKAMRIYGYSKGSIQKATISALKQWTGSVEIMESQKNRKSCKLIEEMLSHLKGKKTSVELQHETIKILAKEAD